jgi:drug/metabolite transporter (DMT)-like permease
MPDFNRVIPPLFVLLWSTGFLGARYAMPWAEPFTFLGVRFALAFAILATLMLFLSKRRLNAHQIGTAMVAGVLIHGVYLGGVFWSVHNGLPAGISALIAGMQPLVTALMAMVLLGERVTRRQWVGLAAGLAGVLLVLWPKLGVSGTGINSANLIASAVALIGICAGTVWQKRFATRDDMIANTAWQYVGAAILMGLGSMLFETQSFTVNGESLFALAWLTLVLSIGAIFLLMRMIRDGEMASVSSLFYLVPAVTAIIAWFLFGETLTLVQLAGMALATFGVALATARKRSA